MRETRNTLKGKLPTGAFLLMLILSSCSAQRDVPNVIVTTVSDFASVFEPISTLTPQDKANILEMRQTPKYKVTWDKFIDPVAINEKELDYQLEIK